uniref:Uncharacterized protein n=1 Tax=Pyrodinium bahamense TaxID=73915 RepID=A0A7S0APV2_9DINO
MDTTQAAPEATHDTGCLSEMQAVLAQARGGLLPAMNELMLSSFPCSAKLQAFTWCAAANGEGWQGATSGGLLQILEAEVLKAAKGIQDTTVQEAVLILLFLVKHALPAPVERAEEGRLQPRTDQLQSSRQGMQAGTDAQDVDKTEPCRPQTEQSQPMGEKQAGSLPLWMRVGRSKGRAETLPAPMRLSEEHEAEVPSKFLPWDRHRGPACDRHCASVLTEPNLPSLTFGKKAAKGTPFGGRPSEQEACHPADVSGNSPSNAVGVTRRPENPSTCDSLPSSVESDLSDDEEYQPKRHQSKELPLTTGRCRSIEVIPCVSDPESNLERVPQHKSATDGDLSSVMLTMLGGPS